MHQPVADALILVVCDFLEAVFHNIVASRKDLYPSEAFETVKLWGVNSRRCRHPGVANYLGNTVDKLKPLISSGRLSEVCVVFFSPQGKPLDRVVLQFEHIQLSLEPALLDAQGLVRQLTPLLIKLQFADLAFKAPLPPGSWFEVVAYCKSLDGADMSYFEQDICSSSELSQPIATRPFKTVDVPGCLKIQVFVDQTAGG
mmetsp:Transcript_346/g.856  ORF Transcript_346/g.856 Transcript_346/m.856 type:complete len:200 (-) Transcript_346:1758-2357(-)